MSSRPRGVRQSPRVAVLRTDAPPFLIVKWRFFFTHARRATLNTIGDHHHG